MRRFVVRKPITLGYDSNVHTPTPRRFKRHDVGTVLILDCESANGNVWLIDPRGERGKIEAGEVRNLTRDGRLEELW